MNKNRDMKLIQLRVTQEQDAWIEAEVLRTGKSKAQVIRDAILLAMGKQA